MSVRRRNIRNRLARDLELERGNSRLTNSLLKASQDGFKMALQERDEAVAQRDQVREKLACLTQALGPYFTDPPQTLSRESELFELLQAIAPHSIPPLRPTPLQFIEGALHAAGTSIEEMVGYARGAVDAAMNEPGGSNEQ